MAAKVKFEDVVKCYLSSLLGGDRFNKTALAKAMNTSRAHLNAALDAGRVTVKHVNGIAAATGRPVSAVLIELYEVAKELEAKAEAVVAPPSKVGETVRLGKRSYVTPRARSEKAERQPAPAPLSQGTHRRQRR